MAAQSNGRAKKPKKPASNGHLNGHIEKSPISTPAASSSSARRRQKSFLGSLVNLVGRLLSWYLLVTIFFRCPSSLSHINDDTPGVCKHYLNARSYAAPYLDPYYEAYVVPQVDKVWPYVDRFEKQVYTPVSTFTKDKYATYGAHRVEQAQKYAEAEWDKTVRPQLLKAQGLAKEQYDVHLGPHVNKATDAARPYYEQTKHSLDDIYRQSLLPAYEAALPYSRKAYAQGHHVVSHIIFPHVQSARDASWVFITRTLWPQLRILYGDNVEPQLVRIRERLGRYRDQQKIESVVDAFESESPTVSETTETTPTVASASTTASSASTKGGWGVLDDLFGGDSSSVSASVSVSDSDDKTKTKPAAPKLTGAELKEKLNEDLRQWQSKFATAADTGAEDLEQRVAEITERQVENGVKGHGAALVVQLEEISKSAVEKFKDFIKQTVKEVPEDATEQDLESAYEKCVAKTRELGLGIKEKAQAIRTWKAAYDQETDNLVRAAVKSTVEVLEKIHGLGLQEVGMRWAWLDGVTYKDWQKYHKLRNTLSEWQAEVEAVGSRHEGLRVAHEESKKLEDEAMDVATKQVGELVRLKDVSRWKIWAEDSSDDFSDKVVPARVFKGAQKVAENVEEAASQASEAVIGSETPLTESIASAAQESVSAAQESVSSASSKISESVIGSETPAAESVASEAKSKASEAYAEASEAIVGEESTAESVASDAKETVEAVAEEAEAAEEVVSSASETPKKVFGGAMAQVLAEAKQVIFDDVIEDDDEEDAAYSQKLQNIVADAGDRAAEVSRAVSEALLGPSKTQGTAESVSSLASEQYEKALAAASSALYGTEQPAVESATSVASEKFADAVTAASYAIYGTPAPTAVFQTIQVQASSRYDQAVSLANEQLSKAKSQLSELISGSTQPAHETMLAMIEKAYSDSISAANERLAAALHYTDSVKSYTAGPTQGYFESVSSIAASRLSDGLSQASAQFAAKPTSGLDSARRQYYEAVGLAHARYSEFLGAASSALYGPGQGTVESIASVASASAESAASDASGSAQSVASKAEEAAESLASEVSSGVIGSETPWTESIASQASQNWEALIAKASSQVYGAPTPWAESVYSQAGEISAQATAQAVQQYAAVQSLISELVIGKEPDFTESVLSRFHSAYYTGVPDVVSQVNSLASGSLEVVSEVVVDAYESASSVVSSIFTPPPAIETILSQASEQLNQAVESASVAVYGTPKGRVEEASESLASAYSSIQSKASEAIYGTQQAQDQFVAVAASAQAAISEAIFGAPTPTGYAASVASSAESVYNSISKAASEQAAQAAAAASSAIYGPEQGAVESASSRLAAAVEAANSRISAFYADAAKTADEAASSVSSVVTEATQRVKDEL